MELIFFDIQKVFLPETILLFFIIANLLISLLCGQKVYKFSSRFALIAVLTTLCSVFFGLNGFGYTVFNGAFISTAYIMFFKILVLIGTFFAVVLSQNIIQKVRYRAFEYYTLLLTACFAAMCLCAADDFISMFVALETLSLSCCLLIAFWNKYKPKEAAMKFLISASVSTGFLLFGISYLYGISGQLNFSIIDVSYFEQDMSVLYTVASFLLFCGLTFKCGCVPFQNWVPDVYQGAPYPVAAFLSVVPKIAGFAILSRLISLLLFDCPILQYVISGAAILTITYGMLGAMRQSNVKRFLGYSSVAHCGFMLLALSVLTPHGLSAFMFYALAYLFMNFGVWAAAITFVTSTGSDEINDYKGVFYVRPYFSTAFLFCLIALAGLPPTSGFLAKLYLFVAVLRQDGTGFLFMLTALLLTVLGIFFYTNFIKVMFDKGKTNVNVAAAQINTKSVLYFCALATALIFLFANEILRLSMICAYGV